MTETPVLKPIGQPVRRKEDRRLLTGRGQFSDDFAIEGQAHAAMVRSPHPHARIVRIDTSNVLAMPGVLAVYTGADCAAEGLKAIPHSPVPSTRYDMKLAAPGGGRVFEGPHLLLPTDKARHAGEAVAMVVAESRERALDAAEAVDVEYEELASVAHSVDALRPGAPAVWDEVPGNLLVETWFGDRGATDRAFAAADHVIERTFVIPRVTACALEPRSALAHHDAASGRSTIWAGSGGAVRQKQELATVLGIDPASLRVLSMDVGGNFGSRNRVFVEFGLILWAARKLGRAVKYTASRSESFVSDYQGRDLVATIALALRSDGKFLALRADNLSNVGARCVSLSPLSKGSGLVTGSYDIPAASLRSRAVFTNTMPTTPYRSSGRPEVTYAIERLVDISAGQLGIDRIVLRRMNLVAERQMPYRNAVGMVYDSGRYEENMDRALEMADSRGFPSRRREAERRGRLLGLGIANYVESSIGSPRERAELSVGATGRVRAVIGTQPAGQGHETTFSQVLAELLGVPLECVDVVCGDTDVVSAGGGSHSGRSMRHAATVFALAAEKLVANAKRLAGYLLECPPERVEFRDGRFRSDASDKSYGLLELAREAREGLVPAALRDCLAAAADNEMHDPVFPNGCAACEVEIDPETGTASIARYAAVDDVGRCVNPLIVHGQTHGALAQGIGQAMSELCALDPLSGQPLAGSFMDYALPRADSLPGLATEIVEVLSPTNPFGIKAGGEGGTTPAPAAVINAIVDALSDRGVREMEMPATPAKVWNAVRSASNDV
jgi:carbon-monoxide dehydrogenase large subunit